MARPPNSNSDQTRVKILDATVEVLAATGPRRFTVRDVADEADVSVPLIHHYFDSKDGLLAACVDRMYEALAEARDEVERELASIEDPRLRLEHSIRRGYAFGRKHRPIVRVLLLLVADAGELEGSLRSRIMGPFLDRWPGLLIPPDHPAAVPMRLGLQSLVFLVGRYALASPRELRAIMRLGDADAESQLFEHVEAHLLAVARGLISQILS